MRYVKHNDKPEVRAKTVIVGADYCPREAAF
jgi:hypothetical protein